ncbi:carbohydrate ABC transporter permease [Agromyces aureus]|uniref:carbohydrate ABC transporter permease n=1 Tax=Agromyces aureus TaxID=453304 RepID=UPI0009FF13D3|nr:carbohydrate ABC transporter permease [Agromyces aureus]
MTLTTDSTRAIVTRGGDGPRGARRTRVDLPEGHGRRFHLGRVVQPVAAVLTAVLLLGIPFWLVIVTASKNQAEALNPNLSLPTEWQLFENFATVFTDGKMLPAFFGSLLVMVPSVLGVLVLGAMAAWVLARRSSRALAIVYALAISGIVLPPAVVTIVLLLRQLGLAGTPIGMICVYMGMYLSTVIFFVTGFVRTIPPELEEAARVDGASPVRVFVTIILPLLMPVLATATILICLYIWNDVFYALFVVGGRLDTLPLNLYQVASSGLYLQNWHLIFAYIILMSLPLLITFMIAQRKIISGITSGAVK